MTGQFLLCVGVVAQVLCFCADRAFLLDELGHSQQCGDSRMSGCATAMAWSSGKCVDTTLNHSTMVPL